MINDERMMMMIMTKMTTVMTTMMILLLATIKTINNRTITRAHQYEIRC